MGLAQLDPTPTRLDLDLGWLSLTGLGSTQFDSARPSLDWLKWTKLKLTQLGLSSSRLDLDEVRPDLVLIGLGPNSAWPYSAERGSTQTRVNVELL